MNKLKHPDLSCNQTIQEAIQKIARHGLVSKSSGAVIGTEKVTGYVAKIHTEGELVGTIDVQEYIQSAIQTKDGVKQGYHEGVLLSAIQDNSTGYVIVPKMYSDVVVSKDTSTGIEYITMFSHVDLINLDSHTSINIEVKEREPFNEQDEDAPDVEELPETGVLAKTSYTKNSITSEVHQAKDKTISSTKLTGEQLSISVNDGATLIDANKDKVHIKRDGADVSIESSKIVDKVGSSSVAVTDGVVYLGSESNTDNAVLGQELAGILSDFLSYMGQMMTATMMGPQPPANLASFISLKTRIDAYKASQSGFLTKKVMVQK